jgi:thiopurine S-methyltransferase
METRMLDTWLARWREGRIGWHEAEGNALLKRYWPRLVRGSRVLVPFCGKSADLLWLATRGLDVSGVEISDIAVEAFFEENELPYEIGEDGGLPCYRATSAPVRIYCGDYFAFDAGPFHSLYDRGALVAVPADGRPAYVEKTRSLLEDDAFRMIITLTYDQSRIDGPPFSIAADELLACWPDLQCVHSRNDIDNSSPKFRQAGLEEVIESVWTSA